MLENIIFGLIAYIGIGIFITVFCVRYIEDFASGQDRFISVCVWPLLIIVLVMMYAGKVCNKAIDFMASLLPPWGKK